MALFVHPFLSPMACEVGSFVTSKAAGAHTLHLVSVSWVALFAGEAFSPLNTYETIFFSLITVKAHYTLLAILCMAALLLPDGAGLRPLHLQ